METVQYNNKYEVNKKQLSIHSEDRDITQWPNSNLFEIEAPVDYKNVVSIQLNDIAMPSTIYVFSKANQNTKLTIMFYDDPTNLYTITISDGTYTPGQLTAELVNNLNALPYDADFTILYNEVNMKMVFVCTERFSFIMRPEDYGNPCSYYEQYNFIGLGRYLGFENKVNTACSSSTYSCPAKCPSKTPILPINKCIPSFKKYDSSETETTYTINWTAPASTYTGYVLEAPYALSIYGDREIYMELDFCNNIDEIQPYTYRANSTYKPKQGGKHNASFAKIPILSVTNEIWFSSRLTDLTNIFFNDPPLERIQRFRFHFRYHDGRPVDFNNVNFTFTLELTMLRANPVKLPLQMGSNHFCLT